MYRGGGARLQLGAIVVIDRVIDNVCIGSNGILISSENKINVCIIERKHGQETPSILTSIGNTSSGRSGGG